MIVGRRMIRLFIRILHLLILILLLTVDWELGENGNNKKRDQSGEKERKTMSTRKRGAHGTDIIITMRYHHNNNSYHLFLSILPLLMQIPASSGIMITMIRMLSRDHNLLRNQL